MRLDQSAFYGSLFISRLADQVLLFLVPLDQPFVRVLAQAQIADQFDMVLGPVLATVCLKLVGWQTVVGAAGALFLLAHALLALWRKYSDAILTDPATTKARAGWSAARLGSVGFVLIAAGGAITAASPSSAWYVAGYLLVVGFDKMFSVAIRAERQRLIPVHDYGKTSGIIVLLNNMTQPLAGLAMGAWSSALGTAGVIGLLTGGMVVIGLGVWVLRKKWDENILIYLNVC